MAEARDPGHPRAGEGFPGVADAGFYAALGRAVKEMRIHRGISRRDLALAAGLSYSYLSEIENGRKRLSARALLYVSRGLDVRPFEILSMAESWASGGGSRADSAGSDRSRPADDPLWMFSQLAPSDAMLVSDLIRRLFRSSSGPSE